MELLKYITLCVKKLFWKNHYITLRKNNEYSNIKNNNDDEYNYFI